MSILQSVNGILYHLMVLVLHGVSVSWPKLDHRSIPQKNILKVLFAQALEHLSAGCQTFVSML